MTDTQTAPATTDASLNLNEILLGLTELFDRATAVANGTEFSWDTLQRFVHDGLSLADKIEETFPDSRIRDHFYERASGATLYLCDVLSRAQIAG
jgi:hypothetical protein